jgi:signal transduction histidine kinase
VKSLRLALWALAALGVGFGLAMLALIATSDTIDPPGAWAAGTLLIGWSFIGVGLFAWGRRPDNPIGVLMTATGFVWFVASGGYTDVPLVFTLGNLLGSVFFAVAIHLLLAFPSGRLPTRTERRIVAAAYLLTTVCVFPLYLFADPHSLGCSGCPDNVLLVDDNKTLVTTLGAVVNVVGAIVVGATLVVLVRRWRGATPAQRRLLVPVYSAGVAVAILLIVTVLFAASGFSDDTTMAVFVAAMVPFTLVPYLFLATLIRARMIQSGAVGELMGRLSETPRRGELRDALARALGDPTIELVYWLPDDGRFVDAAGQTYEPPHPRTGRSFTRVEHDGECVAAIVHDPVLMEEQREHVNAIGAAASLALENERLDAELRAKVDELRASRERMLQIGLEERRRLERDLHDGAQQRLVSMALNLRLARSQLREEPETAEQLLEGAGEELDAALDELRELARGIHPAVLSARGLDTALETLAHRSPVPVQIGALPGERLPEAVELVAYYVVAEALTNVAKYAAATHAAVDIERQNGRLVVQVTDDGVGGADPSGGTGLRGLADRLAVIEGRLEIDSEPGRGTTVTARIPCG